MRFRGVGLAIALLLAYPTMVSAAPEPGPFPSPSASPVPAAGNGYIAVGLNLGDSSGGTFSGANGTNQPFKSAGAGGFSLDLVGRISDNYVAAIKYDNFSIHGDDNPLVSYAQGMLYFNPHASVVALGLGYLSMQRSTASANMNGGGLGIEVLPRLGHGASFYGSAAVFPRLSSGAGSASLSSLDAGIVFSPPKRGAFFIRVGGFARNGGGSAFSPRQISGLTAGVGAGF
ncbi:MAG: hypothetical protein M3Z37_03835 [Candidatus Eremiobacteraeota bacterium]|nr:hypothetical protein [Candidatus Eremiobacteraeota bacterium]